MKTAYTVMWARPHCVALRKGGEEGKPLRVLFGGVHQSAPSLKRAGIAHGDVVFPVSVYNGSLYILAGAVVDKFIELADYAVNELSLDPNAASDLVALEGKELISAWRSELGHRVPYGCGTEVALVKTSTPLRFDVTVPAERLVDVRFCPRKGEPVGLKRVESGKLKSAISLHGNVRRLCEDSAELFGGLVGLSEEAVELKQEIKQ